MNQILGNGVRGSPFKLRPYKFSGVKFRRIPGEEMGLDSFMAFETPFNQAGPMNHAFIPQENNRSFEMTCKIVQKPFNLRRSDVLIRMEPDIQGKAFSFGRDADSRYGRHLRPVSCHRETRSLSPRRPGTPDIGNQEETALVKKDQMGAIPISVFLYAAICIASNALWLGRRVLWLAFRASGSSSPRRLENARDDWGGTPRQTVSRSLPRRASWSIDRYGIPAKEPPSAKFVLRPVSGRPSVFADDRVPALVSWLPRLRYGTSVARETPSPVNSRVSLLLPTRCSLFSAALWRVGAAFRAAFGFRMVSCI